MSSAREYHGALYDGTAIHWLHKLAADRCASAQTGWSREIGKENVKTLLLARHVGYDCTRSQKRSGAPNSLDRGE